VLFVLFSLPAFLVQGASVYFAFHARHDVDRFNEELRAAVESHSFSDDGVIAAVKFTSERHSVPGAVVELHEVLHEIFGSETPRARVLAMNGLSTLADLVLERARVMRRSLPRIPLLSGAASAVCVLSLGVFAEETWPWAGLSLALGFITSVLVSIAGRGARRSSGQIRSLLEVLSRQMEPSSEEHREKGEAVPAAEDFAEVR
jgi:hypothetical protein